METLWICIWAQQPILIPVVEDELFDIKRLYQSYIMDVCFINIERNIVAPNMNDRGLFSCLSLLLESFF